MKTKNTFFTIEYVASPADVVFAPADWSVINIPESSLASQTLSKNLMNTPGVHHLSLVLGRHARKKRPQIMRNIADFETKGWTYLDTVHITYEKANSGSNNGLLPMGESGVLYYKGDIPNTKATAWFSDSQANATNVWDLGSQPGEGPVFYQKFSWELNLLMKSMCSPLEHRTFIYAADIGLDEIPGLSLFCQTHGLMCRLYITDEVEYRKIIDFFNKEG